MCIGILLSGCGIGDGSQIEEVMLTYLALDKYGMQYIPLAPNQSQKKVMDHLSEQDVEEQRNILVESARLGRGRIKALDLVRTGDLSALILPGGLGVFQNLRENPDVLKFIRVLHAEGKPIVAMCAGVVLVAECLGANTNLQLSSANNAHKEVLQKYAVQVTHVTARDCVIDHVNRIISTPAFLASQNLAEIHVGIEKSIWELRSLLELPMS